MARAARRAPHPACDSPSARPRWPAGAGLPYPAGDDYRWAPFGHGGADVDAAAAGGYLDFFDLQTSISGGGPGFDSDRAFPLNTDPRDFAFGP